MTPAYSILPTSGVERVQAINPDTKILFIIRDPVERALSHLRMTAGRRRWTEVGPDVLERDLPASSSEAPIVGTSSAGRRCFRASRSSTCLPAHPVRPRGFLREVEAFIGAVPGTYVDMEKRVNKTAPISIAPEVVARMEERFGAERTWLKSRFGEAFLS